MAKKNRADFFDIAAGFNSRGKRINLNSNGQPGQAMMQDLVDSTVFFTEDIASDVQAKANSGGGDQKLPVVEQLPTVATDDADVEIAVDGATTTRNNFFVRLSTAFKATFSTLQGDVSTNAGNISTNAGNISTISGEGSLAVQKDDATIGTTTSTLNFEGAGVSTALDEGSNKTTITIAGGGGGTWTWVQIELGDWDMNADATLTLPHLLSGTEYLTMSNFSLMIRDDANSYKPMETATGVSGDGFQNINSSNIIIRRNASGIFSGTSYDQTTYNRGFLRFQYLAD